MLTFFDPHLEQRRYGTRSRCMLPVVAAEALRQHLQIEPAMMIAAGRHAMRPQLITAVYQLADRIDDQWYSDTERNRNIRQQEFNGSRQIVVTEAGWPPMCNLYTV